MSVGAEGRQVIANNGNWEAVYFGSLAAKMTTSSRRPTTGVGGGYGLVIGLYTTDFNI